MLFKKLTVSVVLSLSILFNMSLIYAADVIPGGESIGISLDYQGVLITGGYEITIDEQPYNPLDQGLKVGDIIVEANNEKVDSISSLMDHIKVTLKTDTKVNLTVKREDELVKKDINIMYNDSTDQFSTGLYVKDNLMGVGTMTYYNPETKSFGSLGHAMTDVELNDQALIKSGTIFQSNVTGAIKGETGTAGQKIAKITDVQIGKIDDHSQFGIYGKYDEIAISNKHTIETATISEVKLGKAYFLTVLDGDKVVECEIEITHLENQKSISQKGITFEITDKKVLEKTNGIIQGMSGSPIIQDGKLVGCVTHVSSNDPHTGYGLYIEWMLEMDNGKNG